MAPHHDSQPAPAHPTRILIVVLVALFTLAALAYGGGVALDRILEQRRVEARMGPKPRLAQLPEIEVPLGGSRAVEMKVSLVLAPKIEPDRILRYQDRIADRLFQTVSRVDSEALTGPGSADILKARIKEAVNHEAGTGLFSDIYIERMVVK
ncbi:flagellar basal body-associated FliL family protein [Azospirillum sp. B506]|uniref:flagellar basal body-associated FliL family protein n=1 Tax=Azospirillum sp. B506 TaxID=137721 RepID=UPI001FCAC290|nr:flagellar basal body-associated FliL family protein [Azospirillum sp. B506]